MKNLKICIEIFKERFLSIFVHFFVQKFRKFTSVKDFKQILKGFALFETLISLLIITLLVTPFLSWISHIEKLMEKEHQKLIEVHNAKKSLLLKTDIGQAKLTKNAQDKIIGVRFIDKEVKLLE
ncbi:MAG: hypothetical protein LBS28_02375 [Streptococcaceae bacterium]|nr:hypothetical protein [Streptococcaceae bacterium]